MAKGLRCRQGQPDFLIGRNHLGKDLELHVGLIHTKASLLKRLDLAKTCLAAQTKTFLIDYIALPSVL